MKQPRVFHKSRTKIKKMCVHKQKDFKMFNVNNCLSIETAL